MEEKTENNQTPATNTGAASGTGGTTGNAATDKIIEDVKKFNMMSLVGLGMVIAFMLFLLIDAFNYRWWIMLPLAGGAGFLLYRQHAETKNFEKKVCFYGLIVLLVLVIGRDIGLTNSARVGAMIQDKFSEAEKTMKEAQKKLLNK